MVRRRRYRPAPRHHQASYLFKAACCFKKIVLRTKSLHSALNCSVPAAATMTYDGDSLRVRVGILAQLDVGLPRAERGELAREQQQVAGPCAAAEADLVYGRIVASGIEAVIIVANLV